MQELSQLNIINQNTYPKQIGVKEKFWSTSLILSLLFIQNFLWTVISSPYQPKQGLDLRGIHFNLLKGQELELINLGSKDPALEFG